ncbi:MAG: sulfotransferase domain-containing protein [Anaerolineales bacterium]|nr:sulfotransferase domain-containing protein [Anaerolineales bacterium]
MRAYYSLKHSLKQLRWRWRRGRVAARWGAEELAAAPVVIGNAMPKSGSHLITQVLEGLTELGPFVDPGFPPVTRFEDNTNLPESAVLANLQRLRPGDIVYGYLHAKEPFLSALTRPGVATIFVSRDPRDVIVSHVFYAADMYPGHGMHTYYNQVLDSMEARIDAAICGVTEPDYELSPILTKYQAYLDWLKQPAVLSMRFEDLILEREQALNRILDYLETRGFTPQVSRAEAVATLAAGIAPRKSGTFRKGQPGNWREHFTPANIATFKAETGDLLQRLDYEKDADWS